MDWIKLLRGISRHLISPDTSSRKPEICTWFETGSHCNSPACLQSMTHLRTIYQLHHIRMYPVTVWAPSVSLVCVCGTFKCVWRMCALLCNPWRINTYIGCIEVVSRCFKSFFRYPCRLWWSCMNQLQQHRRTRRCHFGLIPSPQGFFYIQIYGTPKIDPILNH